MIKNRNFHYWLLSILLFITIGCNSTTTNSTTPTETTAQPTPTSAVTVDEGDPDCPDYLQFCVTATLSGAESANVHTGANITMSEMSCEAWAKGDEYGILTLPFITAAGDEQLTVALTRIGKFTGAGDYTLAATTTEGNPDSFPAIAIAGRTFSNGEGSTAQVTVGADGSGTISAKGLIEIESMTVSEPDPTARVDYSMQWTCHD